MLKILIVLQASAAQAHNMIKMTLVNINFTSWRESLNSAADFFLLSCRSNVLMYLAWQDINVLSPEQLSK